MLVCKKYDDGCGFAIPIRSLNGAQQLTGGTVSYNQVQFGGQKKPHTWRLNLTHHCGCVKDPATVVCNPFGTNKIGMRKFTPAQAREVEELAGTSQTNDVIYALMSGSTKTSHGTGTGSACNCGQQGSGTLTTARASACGSTLHATK